MLSALQLKTWNEVAGLRFENADLCSHGICRHSMLSQCLRYSPMKRSVLAKACVSPANPPSRNRASSMPRHRHKPLYNCVVILKALSVFQEIFF